ncbi:hypothetical protein Pmani_034049 [Petrolisthes manimaculis]|uniref:Transmembrane protein 209 n=1 Tax=Petrolisthes manimaculis TaxID=1843537 RepID=A0AAE1TPU0_9EUCA|nr:hypothetical protein Pmani_034049 [Petrolisthes manimaculis]
MSRLGHGSLTSYSSLCVRNGVIMVQVSTLVQEALSRKTAAHTLTTCKKSAALILLLVAVLLHDLRHSGSVSGRGNWWWWGVCGLCVGAAILLLRLVVGYAASCLTITPIEVTDKQRTLLAISETDIGFKSVTPKKATSTPVADKTIPLSSLFTATLRTPSPMSPLPPGTVSPGGAWGGGHLSFHSTSPGSPLHCSLRSPVSPLASFNMTGSSGGSVTADSWSYHRNQSSILDTSYSPPSLGQLPFSTSQLSDSLVGRALSPALTPVATPSSASPGPSITDQASLSAFLQQHRDRESLRHIMSQCESSSGMSSSLWVYPGSPHTQLPDHTSALRKNLYQAATKDTGQETNSATDKSEDSQTSTLSSSSVGKIWRKRDVTPQQLFQFTENLRIWLSSNMLVPLVGDIDTTNKALRAAAPEIQIGSVGVDKLKKTAQHISGLKQLADVVGFLDLTAHQDYLVHRLRELAVGGAMSAFRWDSGSHTFSGGPWKEDYPTDSAILLHLFAMYMDRQLPPDIQQPEGRRFSSTNVIKVPEKPPKPTLRPLLYLTQVNPPHVKVILPPDEECEVGSGRNNLFHTLLLFIHHITHHQHSRIGSINLDMSGINLSWVLRT